MSIEKNLIKTTVEEIFTELSAYSTAVTVYRESIEKINQIEYLTEEGKAVQRNSEYSKLADRAQRIGGNIVQKIDKIKQTLDKVEQTFIISPELQSAVATITAAGDKMSSDLLQRIWAQFLGDNTALSIVKAAMDTKRAYTNELEKHIYNTQTWCGTLREMGQNFIIQPGTNLNKAVELGKKLEEFCCVLGIQLDKPFVQYLNAEDYSQFYTENLRAAFGL